MKQKLSPHEATLAFQAGFEDGLDYFFKLLNTALVYYSFRIVRDKDMAEDVVSESWVKIWERHSDFSHPGVIKSWMYTTVRNDCLNKLLQEGRKHKKENNYYLFVKDNTEPSSEENIIKAEVLSEVHKWLNPLPAVCKKIMTMYYFEELNTTQIATLLGLAVTSVRNQKIRGEKIMKEISDTGFRDIAGVKHARKREDKETWELYKKVAECPLKACEAAIKFGLTVRAVYDMRYKYKKSIRGF